MAIARRIRKDCSICAICRIIFLNRLANHGWLDMYCPSIFFRQIGYGFDEKDPDPGVLSLEAGVLSTEAGVLSTEAGVLYTEAGVL